MKKIFLPIILIFALLLSGCGGDTGDVPVSPDTDKRTVPVTYLITRDYGAQTVLEQEVAWQEDMSVMDGLFSLDAEVETAYAGDFVSSINGLSTENGGLSGVRYDWFYYVNGIFADVGALDYLPRPGEIVWWDYHPWKVSQGTPAVIGCWPEPFVHGFRGKVHETVILPLPAYAARASELQDVLQEQGVQSVTVREFSSSTAEEAGSRSGPTIVIGEWPELAEFTWLADFNEAFQRNGTFLHFTDAGLELLDHSGQAVREITGEAGVIMATAEGNGDDSPLWIVTGTGAAGTESALEVLIREPEKIKAAYSAVILPDEVVKLPAVK